MPRYQFWIHSKDADGRPLDETIVKVAEDNILTLTRYREKEIGCESMINALLQSVVEAVSKVSRRKTIRNPVAYLVSAYQHVVDKYLDRQQRLVSMEAASLELAQMASGISGEDKIHRRLVLEKIMKAMDRDSRQIADWRWAGYSMNNIGQALSIRPRLAYARYRRAMKKAVKKVIGSPAVEPRNGSRGPRLR